MKKSKTVSKKSKSPEAYIDINLVTLAYYLLRYKARTTHAVYTTADLLQTCEDILTKSETKGNRYQNGGERFRFVDGRVEVYSKELAEILALPLGVL